MKISVDNIKDEIIELKEDLPVVSWEMDSDDIKLIDNISINCKFTRVHKEIEAHANITIHQEITCSRCLEKAQQTVNRDFKKSYNSDSLGDYLDIDNDIREEILLNFPMKVLCKADCKGVCRRCGVNLNIKECGCKKS